MTGDKDDSGALFRAAMTDVRPLKGRRARPRAPAPRGGPPPASIPAPAPASGARPAGARAAASPAARRAPPQPPLDPAAAGGLDRATAGRLRRGRLAPEARLDLHGLTVAQAERALARFLEQAQATGCRVVLVITGKGLRADDGRVTVGRIRAEFPHWLNRPENRARVHGVRNAHVRHGGGGAFYVLLKRPR